MKKQKIIAALLSLCILTGIPHPVSAASGSSFDDPQIAVTAAYSIPAETKKQSAKAITIQWDSDSDALVKYYYIMRRNIRNSIGKGA